MRLLIAVVTALVVAAVPAAAGPTDDFRACLCWNTTDNNFCGGHTWYDRKPCRDWLYSATGFAVPAVIGLFVLLFFPLIFYCSRALCHCCGGRHRTYGLCCADDSTRHRFPGYSNRTIFISKTLMCVVFGAYIYYAVGAYVSNANMHEDLVHATDDFGSSVDDVNSMTQQASTWISHLNVQTPRLVPEGFSADTKTVANEVTSRVGDIHTVLNRILLYENNQSWGRAQDVYRYPSLVLFVLLLIVLFMFCNVRKIMGPLMVLLCLTSIVEGLVFVPHMVIAQGVTALCDSYNETVVPVVVGAIETQKGCNSPAFFQGLNATAANLEANFWFPNKAGAFSDMCKHMQYVCQVKSCEYNTCGGVNSVGKTIPFYLNETESPFNIYAVSLVMTTQFTSSKDSILTCTTDLCLGGDDQLKAAVTTLGAFYNSSYDALSYLLDEVYPATMNCSSVRAKLQSPLYDDICGGLDRRTTNVAMTTGVLYLLSFLALPVVIRGMKRFMPLQRKQTVFEVARETVYHVDAQVNALPCAVDLDASGGYTQINDGEGEGDKSMRAADSAYYRRFYGVDRADGQSQPLVVAEPTV